MAIARVLTADNEVISITERTVTSPLAQHVQVSLPPIGDGTGGTVVEGHVIAVSQTANGGSVNILSNQGNHVVACKPGESRRILALGDALKNRWVSSDVLLSVLPTRPLAVNGTLIPARSGGRIILEKAFDPANLPPPNGATTTVHTVTGAVLGDMVTISFDKDHGNSVFFPSVSAADTVQIIQANMSLVASTNPAAGTLRIIVTPATGVLPAGASISPRSWIRRIKPDGTVGLIPMWDEVA